MSRRLLAFRLLAAHTGVGGGLAVNIELNTNSSFATATPGTYVDFDRVWHDGDVLSMSLPMALRDWNTSERINRRQQEMGIRVMVQRFAAASACVAGRMEQQDQLLKHTRR